MIYVILVDTSYAPNENWEAVVEATTIDEACLKLEAHENKDLTEEDKADGAEWKAVSFVDSAIEIHPGGTAQWYSFDYNENKWVKARQEIIIK